MYCKHTCYTILLMYTPQLEIRERALHFQIQSLELDDSNDKTNNANASWKEEKQRALEKLRKSVQA